MRSVASVTGRNQWRMSIIETWHNQLWADHILEWWRYDKSGIINNILIRTGMRMINILRQYCMKGEIYEHLIPFFRFFRMIVIRIIRSWIESRWWSHFVVGIIWLQTLLSHQILHDCIDPIRPWSIQSLLIIPRLSFSYQISFFLSHLPNDRSMFSSRQPFHDPADNDILHLTMSASLKGCRYARNQTEQSWI